MNSLRKYTYTLEENGYKWYYARELQKLKSLDTIDVKFSCHAGDTKHLNLNEESIEVLIEWLTELKNIKKGG